MTIRIANDDIELSSPEAALFYGLCHLLKIPVERAGLKQSVLVADNTLYCPEFYLPESRVWVEVADGENEGTLRSYRDAWRTFSTRRLAVLYPEELRVLMTRANPAVAREQLRIWAR